MRVKATTIDEYIDAQPIAPQLVLERVRGEENQENRRANWRKWRR